MGELVEHSLVEFDEVTMRYYMNELVSLYFRQQAKTTRSLAEQMEWIRRFTNHFHLLLSHCSSQSKFVVFLREEQNLLQVGFFWKEKDKTRQRNIIMD